MERKSVAIVITNEVHERVKIYCKQNGLLMGTFVNRLINEKLDELKKG